MIKYNVKCNYFVNDSIFSFVSLSLGLSACNSSGHLSNHAEIAPNHAGITFAISNTLVSMLWYICLDETNYKCIYRWCNG